MLGVGAGGLAGGRGEGMRGVRDRGTSGEERVMEGVEERGGGVVSYGSRVARGPPGGAGARVRTEPSAAQGWQVEAAAAAAARVAAARAATRRRMALARGKRWQVAWSACAHDGEQTR